MFGAQVWPDDFFTHSKGQKVSGLWTLYIADIIFVTMFNNYKYF